MFVIIVQSYVQQLYKVWRSAEGGLQGDVYRWHGVDANCQTEKDGRCGSEPWMIVIARHGGIKHQWYSS
jgi:hypothetical protein